MMPDAWRSDLGPAGPSARMGAAGRAFWRACRRDAAKPGRRRRRPAFEGQDGEAVLRSA